jgi:Ca2+-binding EF-hand superfamily protein
MKPFDEVLKILGEQSVRINEDEVQREFYKIYEKNNIKNISNKKFRRWKRPSEPFLKRSICNKNQRSLSS